MKFENTKKFEKWLKENVKNYNGNIENYLEEVEKKFNNSGSKSYELSKFESKSGNPELYYFDTEEIFFDADYKKIENVNENDFMYVEIKIIF